MSGPPASHTSTLKFGHDAKRPKRVYMCAEPGCSKSFHRKDYLDRHAANHRQVKPFACAQCQVGFARMDILEKHYKSKTHQKKREQLMGRSFVVKTVEPDPDLSSSAAMNPMYNLIPMGFEYQMPDPALFPAPYPDPSYHDLTSNNDKFNWLFGSVNPPEDPGHVSSDSVSNASPPASTPASDVPQVGVSAATAARLVEMLPGTGLSQFPPGALDQFLGLYWSAFNPMYPLVHRPTFDPNVVDSYLVIAVMSIGMVYAADDKAYACSVKIHNSLRNLLFSDIGDSPTVQLSLLQAMLLDNCYCTMLGTTTQFKMSQLFHGTAINLLRFSGYLSNLVEPALENPDDLTYIEQQQHWKEWVNYEACKRTAFFGFILDSQHAALYRHTQLLSAFEIQLELPFSDATWNAANYPAFYKEYKKQPKDLLSRPKPNWKVDLSQLSSPVASGGDSPANESLKKKLYSRPPMLNVTSEGSWPAFLWSMRRLMSPYKEHQKEYPMSCFSQFGRLILLHGLLSISWDLKWRSLLDLGFVSKRGIIDLSNRLMIALLNWRGYFDKQIGLTNKLRLGVEQEPSEGSLLLNDYGVSNIFWTNITLFQMAKIVLHVDTLAIIKLVQDFVTLGPRSTQNVKKGNDARNREKIQAWARTPEGKILLVESCRLLRTVINRPELVQTIPHIPWSIYISSLCIWAYETFSEIKLVSSQKEAVPTISSFKYFVNGEVSYDQSSEDALSYISTVLEEDTNNDTTSKTNEKVVKVYWQVQQQVIAVIAMTYCLLESNRWENTNDLRYQLRQLVDSYKY